jgi:hypothetical protein
MWVAGMMVGLAIVVFAACGGQTNGKSGGGGGDSGADAMAGSSSGGSGSSSGGSSGSSSGVSTGCPDDFTTTTVPVKPDVCVPQVSSITSCMGVPCSWQVEIPCVPDGGTSDDGGSACMDACGAAMPSGATSVGFCSATSNQGGMVTFACGACGV